MNRRGFGTLIASPWFRIKLRFGLWSKVQVVSSCLLKIQLMRVVTVEKVGHIQHFLD